MKKTIKIMILICMVMVVISGCGKKKDSSKDDKTDETKKPSDSKTSESNENEHGGILAADVDYSVVMPAYKAYYDSFYENNNFSYRERTGEYVATYECDESYNVYSAYIGINNVGT